MSTRRNCGLQFEPSPSDENLQAWISSSVITNTFLKRRLITSVTTLSIHSGALPSG